MKEFRYFVQRSRGYKLLGQMFLTREECDAHIKRYANLYKKHGWKPIIIKRKIEIPEPPTEEEKEFMKKFSKGINRALREVLK